MADAVLALNQVLRSGETLEVDEKPKQEDANGDSSSSVQVTCFTDLADDFTLHFQIIRLPNQIYAWIGCNSSKLGRLYGAAPTRPSNSVSVSSILGGVSDNTGSGIARRLVLKTGLNVIVACNIPKNSPMLEANAEKKLVEKLISLGFVDGIYSGVSTPVYGYNATYKADWGDLYLYNSLEKFVSMASFVNEQDGVARFISDAPPTHYKLKIQLFSLLVKNAVEKYESAEFEAGGYKWKLVLYPNGNKSKNVRDHISLYLTLADTSSLPLGWEVYAVVRLFLLDQSKDNYLTVQDAIGKESYFHELKLECGFDHFVPLKEFNDASNGYLVEDKCVFGTEIFVTKEKGRVKSECLSMVKDTCSVKHLWKIQNFSKLKAERHESEVFSAGGQKWKIWLYPKGLSYLKGSHLSIFLNLADFTPDSKVYADYTFRIVDQLQAKHITFKDDHCFTDSSGWGTHIFVTCSHFNDPGNGYLVKDICLVEAENFVSMASFVDEQDGVARFISDAPPTHYKLKIQLFSLLVENAVEKYESAEFEAGGYKWRLVLYPNGNKSKNVKDHISLYLTLANTSSLPLGWEVYAVFRLFLLDQSKDNYLTIQDATGKESHFHELKLECGFDHFVPLKEFNDASNGYLVEDKCVFGTEVFVTKERGRVKAECLSMVKDTCSVKHVWKIENFSKLSAEFCFSEVFSAGGQKWKIKLYPNGFSHQKGSHLSLYLALADFTPYSKIYTDYTLRLLDQLQAKHIVFKTDHCFTAASNDWGWPSFVSLSYLNDPGNGCLVKDICLVEAEVNVWGCQGSTTN
ncbi:hypothetical protein JRO89_XS03G0116800 [Xanthoceras sorbifolium]|uniref:MATH domain-containing protein n=1 Tax=Xanthoceras sorbifolium TaxID=99658 RepID=A0ABQ8I9W5_9ROSI|nr:hypothetical protein JRO89_XS03G0116800 [Xanthoceras sorbifolium]